MADSDSTGVTHSASSSDEWNRDALSHPVNLIDLEVVLCLVGVPALIYGLWVLYVRWQLRRGRVVSIHDMFPRTALFSTLGDLGVVPSSSMHQMRGVQLVEPPDERPGTAAAASSADHAASSSGQPHQADAEVAAQPEAPTPPKKQKMGFMDMFAGPPNKLLSMQKEFQVAKKAVGNTQLVRNQPVVALTAIIMGGGGLSILFALKNLAYGTGKYVVDLD